MAVPIINSPSDFYLYTSDLQTLDVTVDTEQVEFRIYHQARISSIIQKTGAQLSFLQTISPETDNLLSMMSPLS